MKFARLVLLALLASAALAVYAAATSTPQEVKNPQAANGQAGKSVDEP